MTIRAMSLLSLSGLLLLSTAAGAVDKPGQHFLLKPSDLPKPYATPAVANNNEVIPRPPGVMPKAPKGFTVSIYADHLTFPRFMGIAPNGDVFLSERKANKVTLLRDSKGAGAADQSFTFAEGLHNPSGVAIHDGFVYISDQIAIWRTPYVAGALHAGKLEQVTKAPDLRNSGMHGTRNFAIAPDGSMFVEMGSHDNVSEYQPGAKIFQIKDGQLVEYAGGIRNPVGVAFAPGTHALFVATNERDGLGDNLPPDFFTYVKPGGFYGYPWSYTGQMPDPDLGAKRPDMVAKAITPDVLFPAHSAPTGLAFYTGDNFPVDYKGDAFVSLHGSWNTAEPHGYKVVRIRMKNGRPVGGYDNFLVGFWDGVSKNPPKAWGRPVGLAVAKDGSLLVADDQGQTIWKVTYTGKK
ncbi:MAG: PQQ-dependent sugar dehydrogenase [Alphaproteobacteria bacterium]|nr:PQQ-dependent sugar dehydrogenase [Alphaproteobacteria bacterium]